MNTMKVLYLISIFKQDIGLCMQVKYSQLYADGHIKVK